MARCNFCDERISDIDPVHICSRGPHAPVISGMMTMAQSSADTWIEDRAEKTVRDCARR